MNFYFLAAAAWSVRKENHSKKRAEGILCYFEDKLETGYREILSLSTPLPENIYNGYNLYKKGLQQFRKHMKSHDPLLLLKGLSYIEKGREEFLRAGKDLCDKLDENLLNSW